MKLATRFTALRFSTLGAALRRHTGLAAFGLAHSALFTVGIGGIVASATDEQAFRVSHADVRFTGKAAAAEAYALVAGDDEHAQPGLHQAKSPIRIAALSPSPSGTKGLGLQAFDPFADEGAELSPEMSRVRDWISDTYRVSGKALEPALLAAEESAEEHGFDPLLIVAIMAVESSFNPKAESHMGAQGLMQVIPRFHQDKIGAGRDKYALFDPVLNVRVGTLVLQEGVQRYGTLQRALQYYNGSLKDPNARYTRKVMAVKKRLDVASGREQIARQDEQEHAG